MFVAGRDHIGAVEPGAGTQLLIRGEPGTGKSRVALTLLEWLRWNGAAETVTGGSWTGKAASNIGQPTLHRSLNLSVRRRTAHDGVAGATGSNLSPRDEQLARMFAPRRTFIHDECSLTYAQLLWEVAGKLNRLRHVPPSASRSFGNLCMVHLGDFYQVG